MTETGARYDRDIRELAQAIATLEVVLVALAKRSHRERETLAGVMRTHADRALYERDGLDPIMLDRMADSLGQS